MDTLLFVSKISKKLHIEHISYNILKTLPMLKLKKRIGGGI